MEHTRESVINRVVRLNNLLCKSLSDSSLVVGSGPVSREVLLDSLILLYDECNNEFLMKDPLIAEFIEKYRGTILKLRDLCVGIGDFESLKIISKGRFADVTVVKEKSNGNVYVTKTLRKSDILNAREVIYFENERNLMLLATKHEETRKWVPELFYSFQNVKYIYYVMEYCPGGNLCTMLEYYKRNVPEPMLRFYIAEMVQAIHSVHLIGFAHRDIKPENIIVDKSGHLKLIDFGSSAKVSKNGQITGKLTVSTAHYTAPEIYKFQENFSKGYGSQCDWWSLGVVLFELITGSVPFTSDEVPKLYLSSNYSRKLQYPKHVSISLDLKSIVSNLLQPLEKRLNYEKMVGLLYFNDLDWERLRDRDPPFVPSLASPEDTSYFNTFEISRPTPKVEDFKLQRRFTGRNLPFLGFTFLGNTPNENAGIQFSSFVPQSTSIKSRRQTESFKKNATVSSDTGTHRHSMGPARNSEVASECSNDSYQSAASVRLESEVNQLHLFYNEKALIVEEKLKNQFHDIYNCMTEDQQKLLYEKEELTNRLKKMEQEYHWETEELKKKTKELEENKNTLQEKVKEMSRANDELKLDYEEQINRIKKVDKLKKDVINKLNVDLQKLHQDLEDKSNKLKETEEKLLSISNQQAAKLAMLNKTKTTLRSKSVERDKYEHENVTLKNQLSEANKKITKLAADLEKKNKVKLDLELKMTSRDKNGERNFRAETRDEACPSENKIDTEELVKQFENTVRDVLRENLSGKENTKIPDIENMIDTIQRKISMLNERCKVGKESGDSQPSKVDPSVISVFQSQVEHLQSQLKKAEETCSFHRDEVSQLKKELSGAEKQMTEMKIELHVAQHQAKTYDEQLKLLQINKINSEELIKNFESTVKDVLKENLNTKEDVKNPDFESMISKVQRKLSILSERQMVPKIEEKPQCSEPPTVQVLEAQIERLDEQMEKARERAILQREEANAAKSKLVIAEKQLADLKIDLRIAQRETKEAEDQIKELKKKLKDDTQELVSRVEEHEVLLKTYEKEISDLKRAVESKTSEVKIHEANLEDKTSVIHSLAKEVQSMKTKIEDLNVEKRNAESETRKRTQEVDELKRKIERFKNEIEQTRSNADGLKQKDDEWKTKCEKLNKEVNSLRETCEIQDRINEGFESKQQKLEDEVKQRVEEKQILQEELDKTHEELKNTRKMMNEEISLKLVAESRIRHLEEELRKQKEEMKIFEEDINDKADHICHLEEKVQQFEECIFQTNDSIEKSSHYIDMIKRENAMLKQELTDLRTRMYSLSEEKTSLGKELSEAIDEINSLQQVNGEFQLVLDQVKAYYEDRHMKDTTTLQQYSKLNEFLQTKVDAKKIKRTIADKLFKSKGKENLNPKEIENLLYEERNKNKELREQLYRTRGEMMLLKGSETLSKCSSPKPTSEYTSYVSSTPSSKNQISSESNVTEVAMPLHARLKHNIPHKFESNICKKVALKCGVCGQALTFGRMSSYCKECHVRCHVPCSVKLGPTCGLSKALMNQFLYESKNKTQSTSSLSVGYSVKSDIEGTIRVLRDKTWDKMNIAIDEKKLSLFEKSSSRDEPLEQIAFSSVICVDDKADLANFALENVADAKKRCVLRITYRTTGKQEKTLHFLASSEDEKINWMNVLRRNISTTQKQISFKLESDDCAKGTLIYKSETSKALHVNQMISLSSELCLMAANEGLFSLKLNVDEKKLSQPVKISGIDQVKQIKVLTQSRLALFICGDEDVVKKCDLRMLVSNAEAAQCSWPKITTTHASSVGPIENCQLLEASACNSLLAVATPEYLMILKESNDGFDIIKYEDNTPNIVCMLFTPRCLLYCTKNEFYSVDLNTFEKYKPNLFKCSTLMDPRSVCVKSIVKINRDMYLLCDQLFGMFLSAEGKRIKSAEMIKWPLYPHKVVYNKPFLCVLHENRVSLVYLPPSNEESEKKFKFSIIDYHKPSILGLIKEPTEENRIREPTRGVLIKDEEDDELKLYFLDPVVFTRRNPKESWSSIDTQLTGETTDEECIRKSLNISVETNISLNSSILEDSSEQ